MRIIIIIINKKSKHQTYCFFYVGQNSPRPVGSNNAHAKTCWPVEKTTGNPPNPWPPGKTLTLTKAQMQPREALIDYSASA